MAKSGTAISTPKRKKLPTVIELKLGRRRAEGVTEYEENTIYVDPRVLGKSKLELWFHEWLHWVHPEYTEEQVLEESKLMADFFWKYHLRFVENIK